MIFSEPLSQYEEILKDAIRTSMKESGAKLAKTFQTLLIEILTLYMILPRKINFTQMARYGKHGEQTYRQNFNRKKKVCIDWLLLNLSLARRVLEMDGLLAIAIDPCYISKAGKKTPHIGRFWSGCAGAGEEVLKTYRTRFQIEFCYRDSKQFMGLMDCQERHKRQLDFAFNASFASQNAARLFMKDNGMDNSIAKVKSLMFNANYTKLIFDMSRCRPNRTLISKIVKELIGWQPKAA